jgi:predicted dehydrogenase
MARLAATARAADGNPLVFSVGHQRHYNILYENAVDQIRRGLIGEIHHIRAQWHRGNLPGNDSWQPPLPEPEGYTLRDFEVALNAIKDQKARQEFSAAHPLYAQLRSWQGRLRSARGAEIELWEKRVNQTKAQLEDITVDAASYGYTTKELPVGGTRTPLEELIRWRLWNRTGGGLMAELGSHQLDAASIFIAAQHGTGKKIMPLSVVGTGARSIFPADRECDDHVYTTIEFPLPGYFKDDGREVADPNRKIAVTYSSINGSGFGDYGEIVFGTKGTLVLEQEQEALLFKGSSTATQIEVRTATDGPVMDTYETGGGAALAQAALPPEVSRGYREEVEHWAWCVRNPAPDHRPRCTADVALADAVIALVSNLAIARGERIEFDPLWFDTNLDAAPESIA